MLNKMSLWKKILIAILVLVPVLAGFWVWNYIRQAERAATGAFLSPIDNTPILICLVVFMAGYMIFLFFMFYDNIKEYVDDKVKTR